MSRTFKHAAVKPFRVTRSAVEAHREHGATPFLGCVICARRTMSEGRTVRWTSPRLG
ncbi:MAG: hypothetical protein ACXW4T_01060 [Candidatus Limnocylindrales bacterium]